MPECDAKAYSESQMALLFTGIIFGSVLSFVLNVIFAYKWHTQLTKEFRKEVIPTLSAVIVTCLTIERTVRIFEAYLWFTGPNIASAICYNLNNVAATFGVVGALMALLLARLKISFQGTAYEVSSQKMKQLCGIILIFIVSMKCFMILNGITAVNRTSIGQWMLFFLALITMALGWFVLGQLNLAFATRLKKLVVNSAANEGVDTTDLDPNSTPVPGSHEMIVQKSTSMSLDSVYDAKNQRLLRTAAKSMTVAVVMSLSFLFFTVSVILFAFSNCAQYGTSIGHIIFALSGALLNLSVSFSLPHSKREYKFFCSKVDGWLLRLVNWKTSQEVVQITSQMIKSQTTSTDL